MPRRHCKWHSRNAHNRAMNEAMPCGMLLDEVPDTKALPRSTILSFPGSCIPTLRGLSNGEDKIASANFRDHLFGITIEELDRRLATAERELQKTDTAEKSASEIVLVLNARLDMKIEFVPR
ncbi:hypothetical protein NM208_g6088 [Fusarium decemcellulare]|uniref:Uncharacterized protein n=1 Tax=Fusarium decemcellulare TaxID=57161 RepID=A0ACC1SEF5_9HYPO|nr:hypothetical protein NM208_g6088 [Fusarium decemcellulare]